MFLTVWAALILPLSDMKKKIRTRNDREATKNMVKVFVAAMGVQIEAIFKRMMPQIAEPPVPGLVQSCRPMIFLSKARFTGSHSQEVIIIKKTFSLPKLMPFTLPSHKCQSCFSWLFILGQTWLLCTRFYVLTVVISKPNLACTIFRTCTMHLLRF